MRVFAACMALFISVTLVAMPGTKAAASGFVDGVHYMSLPTAVRTSDPNRIEVVEVFTYGSPQSLALFQGLSAWKRASQPADVVMLSVPAVWNPGTEVHARLYYTVEALRLGEGMHQRVYEAIHSRQMPLINQDEIGAFVGNAGVNRDNFMRAFGAFQVNSQVNAANNRVRSYRVTGVPALVVDGRYVISGRGHQEALQVMEYLIAKARARRGR